jgi:hypothetical protein
MCVFPIVQIVHPFLQHSQVRPLGVRLLSRMYSVQPRLLSKYLTQLSGGVHSSNPEERVAVARGLWELAESGHGTRALDSVRSMLVRAKPPTSVREKGAKITTPQRLVSARAAACSSAELALCVRALCAMCTRQELDLCSALSLLQWATPASLDCDPYLLSALCQLWGSVRPPFRLEEVEESGDGGGDAALFRSVCVKLIQCVSSSVSSLVGVWWL